MTTPYVDPQTIHNPATGTSPPAAWGDTVRANQQLFSTPPSIKAVRSTTMAIVHNTMTAVNFTQADEWDTDGFHSTSVNPQRITVPSGLGGKYLITCNILWSLDPSISTRYVKIERNGSVNLGIVQHETNGVVGLNVSAMAAMAPTDYIRIIVYQFTGGSVNVTGTCSMQWIGL
jgi:hypothetical protein